MKYYSNSTGGFYDSEINDAIPSGAIEVDDALYMTILAGQAEGKTIAYNNGMLQLVMPPSPSFSVAQASKCVAINEGIEAGITGSSASPNAHKPTSDFVALSSI